MTDDLNKKPTNPTDAEFASKTWDVLASIGITTITMIPVPPSVIKSLRKTADRFISGATDYGMTYIESATTRRKLLSEGKQKVLIRAAEVVADGVANDNDLMIRAKSVFETELVVKQINKEKVLALTIDELNTAKDFDTSGKVIDDDWLGEFSSLASKRSNEDVQRLLAKILAGEIRHPGKFSPLTLHILSTLTPEVAKFFESFCNLSMKLSSDNIAFLNHSPYPEYMKQGIKEHGVSYGFLMVLQNYGLLMPILDANLFKSEPTLEVMVEIGGKQLNVKSRTGIPINIGFPHITPLSMAGNELRSIISLEVPPVHLQKQIEFLNAMGFDVIS